MVLTLLESILIPVSLMAVIALPALWIQSVRLKTIKKTISSDTRERDKSLELTEFLNDFSRRGYSFLRVDPADVFWRKSK